MRDGAGPFAPPKRLARQASFAWDASPGGSWGSFPDKPQVGLNSKAALTTYSSLSSPKAVTFLQFEGQTQVPSLPTKHKTLKFMLWSPNFQCLRETGVDDMVRVVGT